MGEQQYNIIFRGDIVFGCQLGEVKLRLQQLFKTDEAKINALFTGKPIALKRNLDLPSAERYRTALVNAGAQVEIVAAVESVAAADASKAGVPGAASAPRPTPATSAPAAQAVTTPGPTAADWSLAPVGGNLLNAAERTPFVARTIETSDLGLRPVGGNLLEAHEQRHAAPAQVVVPSFEVASVGSDLLAAHEKSLQPAAVAVNQWDLAEVGADLIKEHEKEIVIPAVIAIPEIGLAPVGSDLGQIKLQVKPLAPNISGIHLLD